MELLGVHFVNVNCELKYAARFKSTLLAHVKTKKHCKKDSFLCLHKELVYMHVRNGMKANIKISCFFAFLNDT